VSPEGDLEVNDRLTIPRAEIDFRASRSGGPGGQHANTSSTRVEVLWNVAESAVLDEKQRARILKRLENRINAEGVLQVASSEQRSQLQNRESAEARLAELVAQALRTRKRRKPTRPTRASKERRLKEKKHRGKIKEKRGRVERGEST
jgi:ribosome-associated protein